MDDPAAQALTALEAQDWTRLRMLLHPYLHWTDVDGQVVRGRSNVMALLEQSNGCSPPASVELRDGQIYRWRASPET